MKFASGPSSVVDQLAEDTRPIILFGRSSSPDVASAGASAGRTVKRYKLSPTPAAWDFLSIALSVVAADAAVRRSSSPDGWTREFDMQVAVSDPDRWSLRASALSDAFAFLTTDRWQMSFSGGAEHPDPPRNTQYPLTDSVTLISGGLDSLIGAIDMRTQGKEFLAVSQTVRGDRSKQQRFAHAAGAAQHHLQLNHNASVPRSTKEPSQRSRSLIFLAFATLAATATFRYRNGETVPVYICENGFIAINPPLTSARVGSLSTRTAHPHFLGQMQDILDALDLRIAIKNPYAEKTKGEMLRACLDQDLLMAEASSSTSCGRYQRYNYTHCGRCIPCQIRRAAFLAAPVSDRTSYYYENLGEPDKDHAAFGDVRSVAMARLVAVDDGIDNWLGPSLSSPHIENRAALRSMLQRGLDELGVLHTHYGIS